MRQLDIKATQITTLEENLFNMQEAMRNLTSALEIEMFLGLPNMNDFFKDEE